MTDYTQDQVDFLTSLITFAALIAAFIYLAGARRRDRIGRSSGRWIMPPEQTPERPSRLADLANAALRILGLRSPE